MGDSKKQLLSTHKYLHSVLTEAFIAVAGPEADLDVFDGHTLYVIPAKETLTFEHTYTWWGKWEYSKDRDDRKGGCKGEQCKTQQGAVTITPQSASSAPPSATCFDSAAKHKAALWLSSAASCSGPVPDSIL